MALRKDMLRARIMVRRLECSLHAHTASGPLRTIDRLWEKWRAISPAVKAVGIPLLMLAVKRLLRNRRTLARESSGGKFSTLMAALPIVLQIMRAMRHERRRAA